jgi:CO/xanthine dehydrogenase Mo-binding subunit
VIVPYVGGGYGGKLYVKAEPISAALSWKTRRPVKLALSVSESFKTVTRHPARVTVKTGVAKDGRLLGSPENVRCTWIRAPMRMRGRG